MDLYSTSLNSIPAFQLLDDRVSYNAFHWLNPPFPMEKQLTGKNSRCSLLWEMEERHPIQFIYSSIHPWSTHPSQGTGINATNVNEKNHMGWVGGCQQSSCFDQKAPPSVTWGHDLWTRHHGQNGPTPPPLLTPTPPSSTLVLQNKAHEGKSMDFLATKTDQITNHIFIIHSLSPFKLFFNQITINYLSVLPFYGLQCQCEHGFSTIPRR